MQEPCTIKEKARNQDDRLPDLDGISLAEVGLALKSHLLPPRASQQRNVGGNFRFKAPAASSGGGCRKTFFPFPLSAFPRAAEISLSLKAGRAQLDQTKEPEATLDTFKKPASEA